MPDNKGWHKRKPPKELSALKFGGEATATPEESIERRRHYGWRKTISASRPQTPVSGAPTTPLVKDTEDAASERSEPTPRRDSKPKLARYTSLFSSFKEASKEPEFLAPWSEDSPPFFEPYINPLNALQSIRSHMISSPSKPIPLEYNNGLFRVFEDYRKVREEKERLEALTQDVMSVWKKDEEQWGESELRYEAEIRRLDLLIAQGANGMASLMKARRSSVVDRRRGHRRTLSNERVQPMFEMLSSDQLGEEMKARSLKTLLQRPTSPSGKMTALSRQFTDKETALPIGDPPLESKKPTLSRKVRSEFNLTSLGSKDTARRQSVTGSLISGLSASTRDLSPNEMMSPIPELVESPVECDAFIALRELGTLVARRRGLNVENFLDALMMLFSTATDSKSIAEQDEEGSQPPHIKADSEDAKEPVHQEILAPKPALPKFQSQPQLKPEQKRRRHFSFEVGDDQLQSLEEKLKLHKARQMERHCTDLETFPPGAISKLYFSNHH